MLQVPILSMSSLLQHNCKPRNTHEMTHTTKQQYSNILIIALFVAGFLLIAIGATAQTGRQQVKLDLADVIELSFINGGGGTQSVTFSNSADLINGKETITQDLRVRSNKKFKIAVSTSNDEFTYSGSANRNTIIPVNTGLKVSVTANNTGGNMTLSALLGWLGLSIGNGTTLLTGCDAGDNQTFTVKYKATPGILAAPGNYTADVIFTATQM